MELDTPKELSKIHTSLEEAILKENERPCPDQVRIAELKREKLKIKDQLAHH